MKIKTTVNGFDRVFLRRMTTWVCRQAGMPLDRLKEATFANNHAAYRGTAWPWLGKISVRVGRESLYPMRPDMRPGKGGVVLHDRLEALVSVTAHEVMHCVRYVEKKRSTRSEERLCRAGEVRILRAFREQREELLVKWSTPTAGKAAKAVKPQLTATEKREARARELLAEWERKAASAKRHVAKYRAKVRYYDRRRAVKAAASAPTAD